MNKFYLLGISLLLAMVMGCDSQSKQTRTAPIDETAVSDVESVTTPVTGKIYALGDMAFHLFLIFTGYFNSTPSNLIILFCSSSGVDISVFTTTSPIIFSTFLIA